jgi:transcriptional regulator GlxA family with amidase domain
VLAHAGLLDGHRATTHWMHAPELARRFPHVEVDAAVLYTVDDGIHTSAGTAAAIDLCLHIVRADHGAAVANEVARRMVTPPHRDGGQAQYVRRPGPARPADSLAPVLDWALEHLDQPIRVQDLALRARMSARTLIRRFGQTLGISPQQWLTQARVEQARRLLETTTLPVERVAQLSGMGSAANLRRHFTERVGVPPLAYRRTFSTASTH